MGNDSECYTYMRKYTNDTSSSFVFHIFAGTQPPTIIMHPMNQSILVNSTFTLQCLAVGYGNISYLWMKYNTTMNVSTTHQRFGELVIEDSNRGSEGKYTCVAYVGEEFAYSSPAFVTVLEPGQSLGSCNGNTNEYR